MVRQQDPERRCIVSGAVEPKQALVRYVVGPEGQAVPDLAAKLPGRGMYVSGDRMVLTQAIQKKAFSRAAKAQVQADMALVDQTYALVQRRVLDLLGLARRAGAMQVGFEQVYKAVGGGVDVLITAQDAAADGARKIMARLRHVADAGGPQVAVPHVTVFDRQTLSAALGLPNVVHAAVIGSRHFGAEAVQNLIWAVNWLAGLAPQTVTPRPETMQDKTDVSPDAAHAGDEE